MSTILALVNAEIVTDPEEISWISNAIRPYEQMALVNSLVPEKFESRCRILHPFKNYATDAEMGWQKVATSLGKDLSPETPCSELTSHPRFKLLELGEPRCGSLAKSVLDALLTHIISNNSTDTVMCAIWSGYGWLQGKFAFAELTRKAPNSLVKQLRIQRIKLPRSVSGVNWVQHCMEISPQMQYLVYKGPVGILNAFIDQPFKQTPNFWWPISEQSLIVSDLDLEWTYVGGSALLIDRILNDPRIEAVAVTGNDRLSS